MLPKGGRLGGRLCVDAWSHPRGVQAVRAGKAGRGRGAVSLSNLHLRRSMDLGFDPGSKLIGG